MKKLSIFLCAVMLIFVVVRTANAQLIDNLDDTVTQIRNDGSRFMWLKDTNYAGWMNWDDAMAWAEQLVFAGYDDWRLPSALNSDGSGPCYTWNCNDSEMGYMYYIEFNNPAGGPLTNAEPFINLGAGDAAYWTNTEYAKNPDNVAWEFDMPYGYQTNSPKIWDDHSAWAVRDMEPIPEPTTILLLGSGLIGFAGARRKYKKQQN